MVEDREPIAAEETRILSLQAESITAHTLKPIVLEPRAPAI
ncbi:MAG: hypothetical protein ACPGVG_07245 [Mycobacterium sp.]